MVSDASEPDMAAVTRGYVPEQTRPYSFDHLERLVRMLVDDFTCYHGREDIEVIIQDD